MRLALSSVGPLTELQPFGEHAPPESPSTPKRITVTQAGSTLWKGTGISSGVTVSMVPRDRDARFYRKLSSL